MHASNLHLPLSASPRTPARTVHRDRCRYPRFCGRTNHPRCRQWIIDVGSADDLFDHRIQLGVDVLVAVQMHGLVVEGLEQQLIALGYLDHNLFVDVKATQLDT